MPTSKKSLPMALRVELTEYMAERHKEEIEKFPTRTNKDLGGFVNDLIETYVAKEKFLKKKAGNISLLVVRSNSAVLEEFDYSNRTHHVDVIVNDKGVLECQYHHTTNCIHTRFVLLKPESAIMEIRSIDPEVEKDAEEVLKNMREKDNAERIRKHEEVKRRLNKK